MKVKVTNFGSYSHLSFDFTDLSLALIHGETGSGKSTLQDMVSWALFGITAKGGSVDEVRNWDNLDEPTTATLLLQNVTVFRSRGKPSQNDLYWVEATSDEKRRGKDVSETQRLLETRLGISSDVFFISNYFNEFSPSGRFFTDSAKNRRALFEKIADLSFPQSLSVKLLNKRKEAKNLSKELSIELSKREGAVEQVIKSLTSYKRSKASWDIEHKEKLEEWQIRSDNFDKEQQSKIAALKTRSDRFEQDKTQRLEKSRKQIESVHNKIRYGVDEQLQALKAKPASTCETCGQICQDKDIELLTKLAAENAVHTAKLDVLLDTHARIEAEINPYLERIIEVEQEKNIYQTAFQEESNNFNPFSDLIGVQQEVLEQDKKILKDLKLKASELTKEINGLTLLNDLTATLRGVLLETAVKEVENEANRILEEFFDSIFKLHFTITEDNLDITILKDGKECSFTQLSKGQRQILKLSYSIATMKKASSECGVGLPLLMFDEALDGLDTNLKVKAYRLFEELALTNASVVLIDHSTELQNLFSKKFYVTMVNGNSEVQEEE